MMKKNNNNINGSCEYTNDGNVLLMERLRLEAASSSLPPAMPVDEDEMRASPSLTPPPAAFFDESLPVHHQQISGYDPLALIARQLVNGTQQFAAEAGFNSLALMKHPRINSVLRGLEPNTYEVITPTACGSPLSTSTRSMSPGMMATPSASPVRPPSALSSFGVGVSPMPSPPRLLSPITVASSSTAGTPSASPRRGGRRYSSSNSSGNRVSDSVDDRTTTTTTNTTNTTTIKGLFRCTHPGCDQVVSTRYSLKRHFKRHTGARPYACLDVNCEREFAERSTLVRHMQNVHKTRLVSKNAGGRRRRKSTMSSNSSSSGSSTATLDFSSGSGK